MKVPKVKKLTLSDILLEYCMFTVILFILNLLIFGGNTKSILVVLIIFSILKFLYYLVWSILYKISTIKKK